MLGISGKSVGCWIALKAAFTINNIDTGMYSVSPVQGWTANLYKASGKILHQKIVIYS